jgi:hypothetical protein
VTSHIKDLAVYSGAIVGFTFGGYNGGDEWMLFMVVNIEIW